MPASLSVKRRIYALFTRISGMTAAAVVAIEQQQLAAVRTTATTISAATFNNYQ